LTVAGSGIGPFDRIILKEQFPELEQYLNYYVMDVGVIGRFLRHCCGMEEEWGERQEVNHRAMNDIHDHYAEFQFYQNWVKR
jgi:oligoribonuclease (3'-5' exoribonuclease)